jgi:glycerate-2-kinase
MAEELETKMKSELKVTEEDGQDGQGDGQDDFVDPWTVKTSSDKGVDYDKLIRKHLHSKGF